MKKRKTRTTKRLATKLEVGPTVIDTIKTEEVKLKNELSECDIADIPIKQEESNLEEKSYDNAFDNQPDPSDPNFYCKSCNKKYAGHKTFQNHIRYVRKSVNLSQERNSNYYNIVPDPDDSKYYCKSCYIKYPVRYLYRNHLRQTHKMILEPLKKPSSKPNHSIKPDPEDPNFYCKSCSVKYPMRHVYRTHIRNVHKMTLEPLIKQTPKPKPNHSIKPDPNDPNFYCKSWYISKPFTLCT